MFATQINTIDGYAPALDSAFSGLPLTRNVLAPLSALHAVYPDNQVVCVQPGFAKVDDDPLTELDSFDRRAWTESGVGTGVGLNQAAASIGNLPYFQSVGVTSKGMSGSVPAALTDYTIAALVRVDDSSGSAIFGVGSTNTTRLLLWYNTNGSWNLQHGTGENKFFAASAAVGTWYAVMASYRDDTKAWAIYVGEDTTPKASGTFTASPPAETVARILGSADNLVNSRMSLGAIRVWNRHMIGDTASLRVVQSSLATLAAL